MDEMEHMTVARDAGADRERGHGGARGRGRWHLIPAISNLARRLLGKLSGDPVRDAIHDRHGLRGAADSW